MWVEATTKLCVKLPEGNLVLEPGQPVNIPKEQAQLLIERAQGKVRLCDQAHSVSQKDSLAECSVVWRSDRIIQGLTKVEFIDNSSGQPWLLVCWQGDPIWIRGSLLCLE